MLLVPKSCLVRPLMVQHLFTTVLVRAMWKILVYICISWIAYSLNVAKGHADTLKYIVKMAGQMTAMKADIHGCTPAHDASDGG